MKQRIDPPVFTWFLVGALLFSVMTFLLGIWLCANAPHTENPSEQTFPVMVEDDNTIMTQGETAEEPPTAKPEMERKIQSPEPETNHPSIQETTKHREPPVSKEQKKVTERVVPKTASKVEEKKTEPTKNTTHTYYIQLTATNNKTAAKRLKRKYELKGYNVYLIETTSKGEPLYKVRIGVFKDLEKVQSIAQKLRKEDNIKLWIVRM